MGSNTERKLPDARVCASGRWRWGFLRVLRMEVSGGRVRVRARARALAIGMYQVYDAAAN